MARWWLLQGLGDHLLDLGVADRAGPARPRLIRQALQPPGHEPTPPLGHCRGPDAQLLGDRLVGRSLGARQHDLQRSASAWELLARRAQRSRVWRSSSVSSSGALGRPRSPYPEPTMIILRINNSVPGSG